MRTKTTMITNKKLGRRRPKRVPYKEPIRRDRSPTECQKATAKKNWAEKARETARKSSTQERNVPLKKNDHEKELGKKLKKTKKKP